MTMGLGDFVTGWAVRDARGVRIKTVSDTRRASIVNWLVTERRVPICLDMTDDAIERQWELWRGESELVEVKVAAFGACVRPVRPRWWQNYNYCDRCGARNDTPCSQAVR